MSGSALSAVADAALLGLGLALLLAAWRLFRGPTLPDRVVAVDLMSIIAVAAAALRTLQTGATALLDVALTVALVAFLGTVAFSGYALRRARGTEVDE